MRDSRVLVIGAGLAGLAAAVEIAGAGLPVLVVDQAQAPGGAVHRQPLPGVRSIASGMQRRRWTRLMAQINAQAERIEIRCNTRFGGMDYTGDALLTGDGRALMQPRALVLATGARERVQPRPGWTLPCVTTAGAIQAELKTTAHPPYGRVLLAGSGPLLLAVAAELVRLGRAPVAVIEAGHPFSHPLSALRLPASYLIEAAGYLLRVKAAGVPVLTGAHVLAITPSADGLVVRVNTPRGDRSFGADRIGLHDGIAPNDAGLPVDGPVPVLRLGDCREALGARAALADGRAGGGRLAAQLLGRAAPDPSADLDLQRQAQRRLGAIYAHDGLTRLSDLPSDTVLCRCENRTLADLRALGSNPGARGLRLDGRFGMGPCQGRFCAEWVGRLSTPAGLPLPHIGSNRWPSRPIPISDLVDPSAEGLEP